MTIKFMCYNCGTNLFYKIFLLKIIIQFVLIAPLLHTVLCCIFLTISSFSPYILWMEYFAKEAELKMEAKTKSEK